MAEPDVRLDLRGLKCPLPALHTRRALERAAPGTLVEVECTDPMAVIDIPVLVRQTGHHLEEETTSGTGYLFRIRAGAASDRADPSDKEDSSAPR